MNGLKVMLVCCLALFGCCGSCLAGSDESVTMIDESALETRVTSLESLYESLTARVAALESKPTLAASAPEPVPLSDSEYERQTYGSTGSQVASYAPRAGYGTYRPPVASGGSTGSVSYASNLSYGSVPVASAPVQSVSTRTRVRTQRQGPLGRLFNPQPAQQVQYTSAPQVSTQTCIGPECNLPN